MKKLLSLIGVITITASSASVVACAKNFTENKSNPEFEKDSKQDTISKLMSQYSKTLYINQKVLSDGESHFSSQYTMENKVKYEYLSTLGLTNFDKSEKVKSNTKFDTIAKKYFDINLLSNDLKLSDNIYQGYVVDPSKSSEGIVEKIKTMLPTVLDFLSDPSDLKGILSLVSNNPAMIAGFISPEILKILGKVLNQENLKYLENAFSNDIYKNMTYQTSLDSSVIVLSNALDKTLNGKNVQKLAYVSQSDVDSNKEAAKTKLATNIQALISGEKSLNVDYIENIDSIAEIIRFVRTLLIYIEQFSYYEMTSSVLTLEQIEAKRNSKVQSNTVDLKQLFKKLNFMVNSDETGISFKNFIGILFATNSTNFTLNQDFENNVNDGLMGLVSKVAQKWMKQEIMEVDILGEKAKIYVNSLIRLFINSGLEAENGGELFPLIMMAATEKTELLPSSVKDFMEKIKKNNDGEKFMMDWMGYLWNNSNKLLNFSIKNLILKPINEINLLGLFGGASSSNKNQFNQSKAGLLNYLNKKSIKDIVNEFSSALDKTTNSKIDFSDFVELIARLSKNNTIENALKNLDKMFEILGYNSDGTIKQGSVLEQLFKILNNIKEIIGVTNTIIKNWIKTSDELEKKFEKEVDDLLKNLKVTTKINSVNNFQYSVTNGKVEYVFNIKLTYNKDNTKLVISEINLV
ncbi:lipoprotein [Spiroplasma endosymbiont of Atherix ibis]|uniref:lipoprotein n=1 Tax=Spiroplasma endosymbiont of Atherix ibis TaxID=3066291 RepID=UPI0030D4D01A